MRKLDLVAILVARHLYFWIVFFPSLWLFLPIYILAVNSGFFFAWVYIMYARIHTRTTPESFKVGDISGAVRAGDRALKAASLPSFSEMTGAEEARGAERPSLVVFGACGHATFVKRANEVVELLDAETGAQLSSGQFNGTLFEYAGVAGRLVAQQAAPSPRSVFLLTVDDGDLEFFECRRLVSPIDKGLFLALRCGLAALTGRFDGTIRVSQWDACKGTLSSHFFLGDSSHLVVCPHARRAPGIGRTRGSG